MNKPDKYILDAAGNPRPATLLEWAIWFESHADRHLREDFIETPTGTMHVSTVFLGLDHSFGEGPPLLWETMIFGGQHDQWQDRYSTRDEAIVGHARAIRIAKGEIEP